MPRTLLAALWALAAAFVALPALGQPYGLTTRSNLGAYLDGTMPVNTPTMGTPAPALLSQTGALAPASFGNNNALVPHAGLVPFRVNSALWSDAALKYRWIGLPYDSAAGTNPTIGFTPEGEWTFPDGTVLVKHFDLVINEQTGQKRRLETRIMVRKQGGYVYGRSYRWKADNSDADVIENNSPQSLYQEPITVTGPDGVTTRQQTWNYPRPFECTQCHTMATNGVLGPRTYQLNGDYAYPTGVTDNQLRTLNHLGMFTTALDEGAIAGYLKAVAITDTSATLQNRVRSYLAANCSHCHRPDDTGRYDARYTTPILDQQIFGQAAGFPDKLRRLDAANSRIILRDSVSSSNGGMPPLAKDVVDDYWIDLVTELVNYTFDVSTVTANGNSTRVKVAFDRPVDPATATNIANYSISNGVTISAAVIGSDPKVVTLTTSTLAAATTYTVTVNRVREAQAPGNPVWPNTAKTFQFTPLDPALDEDNDGVPNGIENPEGLDVFTKDNNVFASARLFAMQQYRDFLGREGDAGGVQFYDNLITSGSGERATVIESFFNSPEFSGSVSPIARLYFATFLRIPDYDGLLFQVGAYRSGAPLTGIATNFTLSPEFTALYGNKTDPEYVQLLYTNILGRTASQPEIDFHVNRLQNQGASRGDVLVGFSESPEYQQAKAIDVYVTMMYVGMLRRAPEQAGFDFWKAYMTQGNPGLALILGFLQSGEYRNRFLPP